MKPTNHIQTQPGGEAYCHFLGKIVDIFDGHIQDVCIGKQCPYLNGDAQGDGIECLWDDGTGRALSYDDPEVLMELGKKVRAKQQKVARPLGGK